MSKIVGDSEGRNDDGTDRLAYRMADATGGHQQLRAELQRRAVNYDAIARWISCLPLAQTSMRLRAVKGDAACCRWRSVGHQHNSARR